MTKKYDTSIIIKCGKQYHPRNNGYQYTSKYCGQLFMKLARREVTLKSMKLNK